MKRTVNLTGRKQLDRRSFLVEPLPASQPVLRVSWTDDVKVLNSTVLVVRAVEGTGGMVRRVVPWSPTVRSVDLCLDGVVKAESCTVELRWLDESAVVLATVRGLGISKLGGGADSLIVLVQSDNLGVPWKLRRPDEDSQSWQLIIDSRLELSVADSPHFRALVLPEIVRQIASAVSEALVDQDDESDWVSDWSALFDSLVPSGNWRLVCEDLADLEQISHLVDDLVVSFVKHHNLIAPLTVGRSQT
jgi:hypothetical protein